MTALCIGAVAAGLFAALSCPNLSAQGLYHDELHQATASFAYIGNKPTMLCSLDICGIPVLNMSYSGAIKTGIYGIYLRYFGSDFSTMSWRLLGILFVSTGIFLFIIIVCRRLHPFGILLLLILFLTDITVILSSRHDYGPVALSMLFRLLLIATWIHGEMKDPVPIINTFILGALAGIAIFEKLSSIILILPLVLILIFGSDRRSFRHCLACVVGLIIGGIPLIIANIYSFGKYSTLISLKDIKHQAPFFHFYDYLFHYLSLGQGSILKSVVLGSGEILPPSEGIFSYMEFIFLGGVILLVVISNICYWKHSKLFRMSGTMILSYFSIGIGLYLFPNATSVHHWIIGTPFHYTSICLSLIGLYGISGDDISYVLPFRILFSFIMILFVLSRLLGVVSVEKSFYCGKASLRWDPSLTKMGEFASNRANEAVFVAADWGVATQIVCFSNGKPGLVYELFWNYRGPEDIKYVIEQTGKKILYIVFLRPNSGVCPESTKHILRDMGLMSGWKKVPVEKDIANLKAVGVRKFLHAYQFSG